MQNPLRILHLEDIDDDAELIYQRLKRACPQVTIIRAENEPQFVEALATGGFDLILSDSHLPRYDGLSALRLAMARRPEVPFLFITAEVDEEFAEEARKLGAADCLQKGRLQQLVASVQNALQAAEERAARKPAV